MGGNDDTRKLHTTNNETFRRPMAFKCFRPFGESVGGHQRKSGLAIRPVAGDFHPRARDKTADRP